MSIYLCMYDIESQSIVNSYGMELYGLPIEVLENMLPFTSSYKDRYVIGIMEVENE